MYFTNIDMDTALKWIKNNPKLKMTKHEHFFKWKEHLLKSKLDYFYWEGSDHWSAAVEGDDIVAIYYYNIARGNMYDGFLVSDKIGAGIKLDRWQYQYTKDKYDWKLNWTMAAESHVKYNQRLGYRTVSRAVDGYRYMVRK